MTVSQITDKFVSAPGLPHAHAWVIIMLFVLISERFENERGEAIPCCQSQLACCKFGEIGPWPSYASGSMALWMAMSVWWLVCIATITWIAMTDIHVPQRMNP